MDFKLISQKYIMEHKDISADKKIVIIEKIYEIDKNNKDFFKNLSEDTLQEINWGKVALVGGVSLVVLLSIWSEIIRIEKNNNSEWRKCRDKCLKTYAPKIKRARDLKDNITISDIKDLYDSCIDRCDEIYDRKKEALEKKKKEVKSKIVKTRSIIKQKKKEE